MKVWVDADACPRVIKEILYRAANRTKIKIIFVANQALTIAASPFISKIVVSSGFDVADNYIIKNIKKGDIVISADIPLADAVIQQGGVALNPRGELYTESNIKLKLSIRDFSTHLRSSGMTTGGPDKITQREIQSFANHLDRLLSVYKKE